MERLITCEEAAQRLGIHVATIRGWIRGGKIPAYRLGQRFTRLSWAELMGALGGEADARGEAGRRSRQVAS